VECKVLLVQNIAPAAQNGIPQTTDLHQMLRLPRKMTMVVSNVLLLPRKMQLTF